MLTTAAIVERLRVDWEIHAPAVAPLGGGMNSQTWLVTHGEVRFIAKAVPSASQPQFAGGLVVAAEVEAAGVPAGAPVPTRDGRLTVGLEGRTLALLTYVPGTALSGGDEAEQKLIGSTLGRVHRALAGIETARLTPASDLDPGDAASGISCRTVPGPTPSDSEDVLDVDHEHDAGPKVDLARGGSRSAFDDLRARSAVGPDHRQDVVHGRWVDADKQRGVGLPKEAARAIQAGGPVLTLQQSLDDGAGIIVVDNRDNELHAAQCKRLRRIRTIALMLGDVPPAEAPQCGGDCGGLSARL
jgi:hypothetical protein